MVTGEYTLSFRSTEAKHQAAAVIGSVTVCLELMVKLPGFALAQLVSMEKYYRAIKADPTKLPPGVVLNVTGYSLGGHLRRYSPNFMLVRLTPHILLMGPGVGGSMAVRRGFAKVNGSEKCCSWPKCNLMLSILLGLPVEHRKRCTRISAIETFDKPPSLSFDTTNSFLPGEIRDGRGL